MKMKEKKEKKKMKRRTPRNSPLSISIISTRRSFVVIDCFTSEE